jgi:hypothetical protein
MNVLFIIYKIDMDGYYRVVPNDEHMNKILKEGTENLKTLVITICKDTNQYVFEGYLEDINELAEVLCDEARDGGFTGLYYDDMNIEEISSLYKEIFNRECPKKWLDESIYGDDAFSLTLFVLAYVTTFTYNDSDTTVSDVDIIPDTNMLDCQLIRDEILKHS